jgi:hypothetical protein
VREPGHFAQFQLSENEVRGFIAEAVIEDGKIDCAEHVRKWVPIFFELRRSKCLDLKDQFDANKLINLDVYEDTFPILTEQQMARRRSSLKSKVSQMRGINRLSTQGRRHSQEEVQRGSKEGVTPSRRYSASNFVDESGESMSFDETGAQQRRSSVRQDSREGQIRRSSTQGLPGSSRPRRASATQDTVGRRGSARESALLDVVDLPHHGQGLARHDTAPVPDSFDASDVIAAT